MAKKPAHLSERQAEVSVRGFVNYSKWMFAALVRI